ncbi:shikimate 5-dehydrogenase [Corynebacterium caspium]|uniref:shikimate 5-dehydrogenase n=1 Tax=Corynebacterium caspium TaxID=234828 RepID=UPI00035F441A|nr:shikimate 5-dehydrogenase [Corynebacterium caspium]WKD59497.1 Shikimate 5-dehydrogenase-like protein [Corynebacterium caspium DSM 44850]
MIKHIDRETSLCISLASTPSNHGVRFHNYLYGKLGLNFIYKAIAPADIIAAVAGIRGLNIRGAGVSMPYKQEVIDLLDELHPSASRINSVNTIVNNDGILVGYNTDYTAVHQILRAKLAELNLDPSQVSVAARGSGGMANAVVAACADLKLHGTVVARNHMTGSALAEKYGWEFSTTTPEDADILINITPIGMAETAFSQEQSFSDTEISRAQLVFDAVAWPVETPLIKAAKRLNIPIINGGSVVALQAAEQFILYTGKHPSTELIQAAEQYAQQS